MGIVRTAEAEWKGDLMAGEGMIKLGSKSFEGAYSFKARTADESPLTNPEELIGAAHAGCYSMQLSAILTKAGHAPEMIHTTAKVHLDPDGAGFKISQIDLTTEGKVQGMSEDDFIKYAEQAKESCPVSKALAAVKIEFKASLI